METNEAIMWRVYLWPIIFDSVFDVAGWRRPAWWLMNYFWKIFHSSPERTPSRWREMFVLFLWYFLLKNVVLHSWGVLENTAPRKKAECICFLKGHCVKVHMRFYAGATLYIVDSSKLWWEACVHPFQPTKPVPLKLWAWGPPVDCQTDRVD